jgi:hypothetical protein
VLAIIVAIQTSFTAVLVAAALGYTVALLSFTAPGCAPRSA